MVHSPCLPSVLPSCPFLPVQPACLYLVCCYEFQMLLFHTQSKEGGEGRGGEALITCSTTAPGRGGGRGGVRVQLQDQVYSRGAGCGGGLSSSLQHTYRKS